MVLIFLIFCIKSKIILVNEILVNVNIGGDMFIVLYI